MANLITSIRIIFSITLLFCRSFSTWFYVVYIITGLTDVFDGFVARKTNTVSEFGSKFDTGADFVFVSVCLIKLLPILNIGKWIFVWIGIIVVIKLVNIISGYVCQKRLVAVHSVMNKITGGLLFALPLTLRKIEFKYSVAVVCAVATFAAVQEGHYIRTENPKWT